MNVRVAIRRGLRILKEDSKADQFRAYGAEVKGNKVVLYRGGDVSKEQLRNLRYGDYLSAARSGSDATGNDGAASYGKNVIRVELPLSDVEVTGAGEFQYKGKSPSLKGGGKYPESIYRAYNDFYGSNFTAQEIDKEDDDEVRRTASGAMPKGGGREEFDRELKKHRSKKGYKESPKQDPAWLSRMKNQERAMMPKYPDEIYIAYSSYYGSRVPTVQIDKESESEVRSIASMGLSGGSREFDTLLKKHRARYKVESVRESFVNAVQNGALVEVRVVDIGLVTGKRTDIKGKIRWLDAKTEQPLKDSDSLLVYHGFNNFQDAVRAATKGLSGKDRAPRNYSFEGNNNPKGLFVTANFQTAKEFVGTYGPQAIIEFHTKVKDLEAPVWPGGSYTIQGQAAQYFKGDPDREKTRLMDRSEFSKEYTQGGWSNPDYVRKSDRPEVAGRLWGSEAQSLFIGDLNPNGIRAIWVAEPNERGRQTSDKTWVRMSVKEFLKRYPPGEGYHDDRQYIPVTSRVLKPRDKFNPKVFLVALAKEFGGTPDDARESLVKDFPDSKDAVEDELTKYVWPAQLKDALAWVFRERKKNKG